MKKIEKSLQRLTVSKNDEVSIEDSYKYFKNKYGLSEKEVHENINYLFEQYTQLQFDEKDELVRFLLPQMTEDTKNVLWEINHSAITRAITALIRENGRIPSQSEIAYSTKLSRQTVNKHMKQFRQQPASIIDAAKIDIMADSVVATVYKCALQRDMKAARLFFDMVGKSFGNTQNNLVQNNFVQINNIKLSQQRIKELSPEKLSEIEEKIKDIFED